MFLILQRSPEREASLRQFLQKAHTPQNPSYHKWLRPEQFGSLYGPLDSEITTVTLWLQKHGFSVARVTRGKTALEFSGTAGQLRQAFNTEIHTYLVNGEEHHANNRDPQIPAALAPAIAGITPMNDFRPRSYVEILGQASYDPGTHQVTPQWTFPATPPFYVLAPGDFAVQYDLNPLYSAGTNGAGITIGIIGASNVDPTVVAAYRSLFGLPAGTLNVIIDGNDPGQNGAYVESYLDVEVSGAVAPGAKINLYTSADTAVQSGLYLAAQRAVDDDEATVLSTSYGICEQNIGSAGNQFWAGVWEQAAAQGQTSFVSAGDGGSAGCDDFDEDQPAQFGLAVNGFGSTPWNVSVGGTDFYYTSYNGNTSTQAAELATYWNSTPTNLPATSLLKTIPEQPWNRPFGLNLSTGGVYNASPPSIVAGSGGASSCVTGVAASNGTYSSCTAGYPKPSWQSGPGVPKDGVRDLPDVSLFAAVGENYSFYPICVASGECVPADGGVTITGVGGTSASSPAMAGIMALINQRYGAQGQADFTLYPLATQHSSVFHDVAVGSNIVPCMPNTPNCSISSASDNTNGFYTLGVYRATAGYDRASGLGSVDANELVSNWNSLTFTPTTTTLSLSQTAFTHGTPITVNVGVTGKGGTPSGEVALVTTASPAANTGLSELPLQNGSASASVNSLPGGQYKLKARYSGDSIFASSTSALVSVNVSPEPSSVTLSGSYINYAANAVEPLTNGGSYPYGTPIFLDAQPRAANAPACGFDGIPTGTVSFTDAATAGTAASGALHLDRSGTAEWIPSTGFAVGNHSVSAGYSGDASFNPSSTSTPFTFTITKTTPSATLTANPPAIGLGASTILNLIVGITAAVSRPTGTATFYSGSTALGTATLGPAPYYNPSVASANLTLSSALLTPSGVTGTYPVTASYNGDSNYNAVTTSSVNVMVMQNASLSGSANPSSANEFQSFTVTGTVVPAKNQPAPTGGIDFYAVGPNGTWTAYGNLLVNGSASFTFPGSYFGVGAVSVQVSYSGDTVYAPASVTVPVTITVPFTLGATPIAIATPGATTGNTSTVTVTPVNGFTGTVSLSCGLTSSPKGAQDLPTCTIPGSVNITNAKAIQVPMDILSTAASSSALLNPLRNQQRWLAANAGVMVAAFVLLGVPLQRRSRRHLASFLFMLALLVCFVGCGGGSSSGGGGGGGGNPGTTAGTYTFMVNGEFTATGGGSVVQAATVTVTIK